MKFANTDMLLYDMEIKPINQLTINDLLINEDSQPVHILNISKIRTKLHAYDKGNKTIFLSQSPYKNCQIKYDFLVVPTEAYYSGYNHIYKHLLASTIQSRLYILAGCIDYLKDHVEIKDNVIYTYDAKLMNLIRSLGFICYEKEEKLYIEGNLSIIPSHHKLNDIPVTYSYKYKNDVLIDCYELDIDSDTCLLSDYMVVRKE